MRNLAICRLGWWALQTTASGIALVRDGSVSFCNARWYGLSRTVGRAVPCAVMPGEKADATPGSLRDHTLQQARMLMAQPTLESTMSRFRRVDGDQVVELRAGKLGGDDGMVVVLAHDVTEQLRAETQLRVAQEALHRRHRMEAIGELASGLAHDLNNALNVMRMRLELLRREMPEACRNPHVEAFGRIVADAAARVLRMHELSRRQSDQSSEDVDLRQVIDDAIAMARTELEPHSAFGDPRFHLHSDVSALPPVRANPAELKHLFVNLLLNARDAMPDGGTISVQGSREDDCAVVRVSDEGVGIPEEHLEAIFDSFFTTKGTHGTGLGLSMARSAMARLGGSIVARNRAGRGAEFVLRFPLSAPSLARKRVEPPSRQESPIPPIGRSLRVLLVDDDPDCLEVTKEVLRLEPLEIETANSGTEALARLGETSYDLLLCDVGMPDMSGWQVAQKARLRHPAMSIFMVTGWANEFASADSRPGSVDGVIAKPVEIDELRALIARTAPPPAEPGQLAGVASDSGPPRPMLGSQT